MALFLQDGVRVLVNMVGRRILRDGAVMEVFGQKPGFQLLSCQHLALVKKLSKQESLVGRLKDRLSSVN